MLKLNPAQIKTFVALLAVMIFSVYFLSDKMIETGLFTKDTVNYLLGFLLFVLCLLCYSWVFNNISEKEIDAETRTSTNINTVLKSPNAEITNKSKGNDNTIQDSEGASIKND